MGIDTNARPAYRLFTLRGPDRVVIDFRHAAARVRLALQGASGTLVRRVRHARRHRDDLRVVLDLRGAARVRSRLLRVRDGYRLRIDLVPRGGAAAAHRPSLRPRDVVIAVDAGHGGSDPGAIGVGGVVEKRVTLAIARKLARLIDHRPGMRAVLTRRGDYYVGLRRRMEIARAHHADLFVSIHADSFPNPRMRGASVYVLSRHGASSEAARWLADRENGADRLGTVTLEDKDRMLTSVLLNLSQAATLRASVRVGDDVLHALRAVGATRRHRIEHAGFMVLKSPDVPSILVETAYVTNPRQARALRTPVFQRRVARAILGGIRAYFEAHAPPGTLLAESRHVIRRGESLRAIAARYHVSVARLREVNRIRGNAISSGEVLRIPPPGEG